MAKLGKTSGDSGDSDELTRDEVRQLQTDLVRQFGARIGIDGQFGPLTYAATLDALDRGAHLLSVEAIALVRRAAVMEVSLVGSADPYVWFFGDDNTIAPLNSILSLADSEILWKRGPKTLSDAKRVASLGTCDSVVIGSHGQIVATGILLAGDSLEFSDRQGFSRYPVRILEKLDPPIPYKDLELPYSPDGIALLGNEAVQILQDRLISHKARALPLPATEAYKFASSRSLVEWLNQTHGEIVPSGPTAGVLGWTAPVLARSSTGIEGLQDGGTDNMELTNAEPVGGGHGNNEDARFPLVLDGPAGSEDDLDRGPFALFLAQRLHLIWCQVNGCAPGPDGKRLLPSSADADAFIAHIDSPWGGGKTTFANFVARVLDPRDERLSERHFLRSSLAPTTSGPALASQSLTDVFVPDFARRDPAAWKEARRPWIVANYNAWRDQYVLPPWWHLFQKIEAQVSLELRNDAKLAFSPPKGSSRDLRAGFGALTRWLRIKWQTLIYKLWNGKVQGQALTWLFMLLFVVLLDSCGVVDYAVQAATKLPDKNNPGVVDPKELTAWISLVVAIIGLSGASLATLFTVTAQSLSPDLDFTAESKQIGVRDPISRFRRSFHRILELAGRPTLLIVDDLDRCEPGTVVEILRGFQTIVRSPRLFVLLLGDRAWIETAHDVQHKAFGSLTEGEGSLGALFVQKVIQLSFRLPTIKDDARDRFARAVLGDVEVDDTAVNLVREAIAEADRKLDIAVKASDSVAEREEKIESTKQELAQRLGRELGQAEQRTAASLINDLANVRLVAAAGADTRQQQSVARAVQRLIENLPNNPRQIKRIFMAFSTYEAVGRAYYGYSLTAQGEDGELRARRWRQLAMWVALATEWPETWRAIARCPELADAAYSVDEDREAAQAQLLEGLAEEARDAMTKTLTRLRSDPPLVALLSRQVEANDEFARITLDSEAVYEFNRIIWEPSFKLKPKRR